MQFNDVIGMELPFYGVDNNAFKIGEWIFEAIEDEEDGYRSCLGATELINEDNLIFFRTPVANVKIVEYEGCDHFEGYELVDNSGHVWLRFGTDDFDDYYPCFIFQYQPSQSSVTQ